MAEKKKRASSERFNTPIVEFQHTYIHKPDAKDAPNASEYADDKYKTTGFIEVARKDELKDMKQIILKTGREEFGKDVMWKDLETPFRLGNDILPDKLEKVNADSSLKKEEKEKKIAYLTELYADKILFTPKSKKKPGVVGADTKPLPEDEEVQSTDTGRLRVHAYAYERVATEIVNGKKKNVSIKGVALSLDGVQKKSTGPRPFAGSDGSQEFEALPSDADDDVVGENEDFEDETEKKPAAKKEKAAAKVEKEEEVSDDDEIV